MRRAQIIEAIFNACTRNDVLRRIYGAGQIFKMKRISNDPVGKYLIVAGNDKGIHISHTKPNPTADLGVSVSNKVSLVHFFFQSKVLAELDTTEEVLESLVQGIEGIDTTDSSADLITVLADRPEYFSCRMAIEINTI